LCVYSTFSSRKGEHNAKNHNNIRINTNPWSHLNSVCHLNPASKTVVSSLLDRSLNASPTDPTHYCTILIQWGATMGLSLSQSPYTPMPPVLEAFRQAVAALGTMDLYSDGSFAIHNPPLLSQLAQSRISQTRDYGVGATGIYIHPKRSLPPMALKLVAPPGRSPDPFYYELLGIAVGAWLTLGDTLARSDCTSAIRCFRQASNPTGAATGHLQYGPMLQGVRARSPHLSHSLEWTKAHPERKKPEHTWTPADIGIHTADLIAGDPVPLALRHPNPSLTTVDADQVHSALIPADTWVWKDSSHLFTGSLKHHAQRHHFQTYLTTRDTLRDQHTPNGRWTQYCHQLMGTLTKATKHRSPRNRGQFVKHPFDWMAHASNLAKVLPMDTRTAASKCLLCGKIETQAQINTICSHPALLDLRHLHRRQIDLYLLALRCTPLPPNHQ
jgi:hypothetical protein